MIPRIDRVVTSGTLTLEGEAQEIENNVWLLGDDHQVLIIDAAHDAEPIRVAADGRQVCAIACTNAHNDHINVALELAEGLGAPILLHPADLELWQQTHPHHVPDGTLAAGDVMRVAGVEVQVLETPGPTPGSTCLYVPALATVFTGDALLAGGRGPTSRCDRDVPALVSSVRDRLLTLPPQTRVLPGHGNPTTIRNEAAHLEEWIAPAH